MRNWKSLKKSRSSFACDIFDFTGKFKSTGKTKVCDKCNLNFASDDFLKIQRETRHKIKCDVCDFESGNKESMKEQLTNPRVLQR